MQASFSGTPKNPVAKRRRAAAAALSLVLLALSTAAHSGPPDAALTRMRDAERIAQAHLAKFDTLDFDVYTNQKWDRLAESHSEQILVHYPDGHTSQGLKAHIDELKPMFVFAPDTRIRVHPVKIASGEWTSVIGVIEGTFSQPMPVGEGKTVAPTGKKFQMKMNTVGHWKNGVMDEEYLFWDNANFMKQIGVGQ